jgi:uncharacterized protein (TIGR03435 family)
VAIESKFIAPDWLSSVRFDVSAKIPQGTTPEAFHAMLQNLLAERFKLAVHREKKEMPVYEMSVAKNGPKFKETVPKDAPADDPQPGPLKRDLDGYPILPVGYTMGIVMGHARLRSDGQTISWLAEMLSNQLRQPVIDATGLSGKYDFLLSWVLQQRGAPIDSAVASADASGPDLLDAVQSQLGLKLQQKKSPVEVLVVDHIEKVPTEN